MDVINIIVPVYNTEKYLERCLDSIFNQTYKNVFVYLVNDGSTDQSLSILELYSKKYNNSLLINKSNGGLSSARNIALSSIKKISETYLMFVDSDDYIELDYCERMVRSMNRNGADVVCSNLIGFDDNGSSHLMYDDVTDYNCGNIESLKKLFSGELLSQAQGKLFRGELFANVFFNENIRFMEDQELMFKIFYKTRKISYIDFPGYHYFYSQNSLIRSKFNNKKVLDALFAYYNAIVFDYDEKNKNEILPYARDCFASAYLMLLPRFNSKNATKEELRALKEYKLYVRNNKVVKKANFKKDKDVKKRKLFIVSPFLYVICYRIFIYKKDVK